MNVRFDIRVRMTLASNPTTQADIYSTFLGTRPKNTQDVIDRGALFQDTLKSYLLEKVNMPAGESTLDTTATYMQCVAGSFSTEAEKEDFYRQCTSLLLEEYGLLTSYKKMVTEVVSETPSGEFPRMEGNVFKTLDSYSNEQNAVWLCGEYERALARLQRQKEKGPQKVKKQTHQ